MALTNFPNGVKIAGYSEVAGATIVVGDEETNVVNVAIQLTDGNGDNLDNVAGVLAYLSDAATGDGLATTAADSVAIGTDGVLAELVAGSAYVLISDATGAVDIDVTQDAADTLYLILVLPSGKVIASSVLTFEVA